MINPEINNLKKILVVAESLDVNDSSGSKANVALIMSLKQAGFKLKVYHYTRKDIFLEGIETISIKENRNSPLFLLSRIERQIRYKLNISLNPHIERLFGFSFTLMNDRNSIAKELKHNSNFNFDLVLTLSKGGSFRPHHALLKIPDWHSRWIAYIHDPYPMHSYPRPYDWVEPGHQKKRSFFTEVARKCRYAAYPSKMLAEWMESYYPEQLKGKRLIIPHQLDSQDLSAEMLPDFFKKDSFTIVHAGALMGARNPMGLVNAFKKFLIENPQVKNNTQLIFLGEKSRYTAEFNKIKKEIPQLYSSDENLPFSKVLAIQKQASVNVILEAKGPSSPFLPGKFPHCIQANKPILLLGPYYSECRRLLGENYQFWSEIDDEESILKQLNLLYNLWKENASNESEYKELKTYLSPVYLRQVIEELSI